MTTTISISDAAIAEARAAVRSATTPAAIARAIIRAATAIARAEGRPARVVALLAATYPVRADSVLHKSAWARQNGRFLSDVADLRPGTWAEGRAGRPAKTRHYVLLGWVGTGDGGVLAIANSAAIASVPEAIEVWGETYDLVMGC